MTEENTEINAEEKQTGSQKKKKIGRYFVSGMANTLISYAIYEALALTVFRGELLPAASLVSGVVGILTGYFLHSQFTWKGREIGKKVLAKFFVWNVAISTVIKPALTAFFRLGVFGLLYKLAFDICQFIHIPFSYEFVESTGNFVLGTAVIMVINFLVYDRFVFGKKRGEVKD
ncbi:GtrA family protein [Candidatus Saccharibacteria bacterium]|nr:GtrA family protein [Candidatus Saccharibacteria bacterium]